MNLSKDLVPIIYKKDMDKEATKFLLKYCPEALEKTYAYTSRRYCRIRNES